VSFVAARRLGESHWYDFFLESMLLKPIEDSTNDAAVRSTGIDPRTDKPIAPQYQNSINSQMVHYGIDPSDPKALEKLVAAVRRDEEAYRLNQYNRNMAEKENAAFPWGKVIGWGAVGLLGTIVLTKVM
jgi:hypothetical protein